NEEVNTTTGRSSRPVPKLEITDAIMDDFKDFLRGRHVELTDEEIQSNVDFIKRRIKQEVYTSSFGMQEGFKIAIQADPQVVKALEALPEAKVLMTTGRLTPAGQNPELK